MSSQIRSGAVRAADYAGEPLSLRDVLGDWYQLFRIRVGGMVFVTAFIGGLLASGSAAELWSIAAAGLWITCIGAAASGFNQVMERDLDALMPRTQNRPLVTGRMPVRHALYASGVLATGGIAALAWQFNLLSAFLGLATLSSYCLLYTPLKRQTTLNTVIGAVPGAMPPLIGYVAIAGHPDAWGWMLFAILFTWQFPHFMAIAWMYREDYAAAGMKMLPAVPGAEGLAGRQALAYSLVLLPVSLLPSVRGDAGLVWAVTALVLGLAYAASSALFALKETRPRARAVLLISLVHLPLLFSSALFDPEVLWSLGK